MTHTIISKAQYALFFIHYNIQYILQTKVNKKIELNKKVMVKILRNQYDKTII